MIEFDTYPRVSIQLEPGLYIFTPDSATGKTYLAKTLCKLAEEDSSIFVYSYADYLRAPLPNLRLKKVVVLDRYDMYSGDERIPEVVTEASRYAVVLLDAKASVVPNICSDGYVDITLEPGLIEVSW